MNIGFSTVHPGIFVRPAGALLRCAPDETALSSIWEEVGECFCYAKPDGWRFQIHKRGKVVNLFSRSGKEWTREFPTIVEMIQTELKCDEVILDAEIVGFNNGRHLEPSELCNAPEHRCYLLDVLYLNGCDLTEESTKQRVELLWEYLGQTCQETLIFANYTLIRSLDALINFYKECRRRRCEGFDGVIIKLLDAPYFTDVLKVKPKDTIDAVVVGAYINEEGTANKLLLALPSLIDNSWKPIAKVVGSGLQWNAVWSACHPYLSNMCPHNLDYVPRRPNIWVIPKVVVSIQVTEFKLNQKNYKIYADAARECVLRKDKGPEEASSFEMVYQRALSSKLWSTASNEGD